jgi:hypothetical protein
VIYCKLREIETGVNSSGRGYMSPNELNGITLTFEFASFPSDHPAEEKVAHSGCEGGLELSTMALLV